jgi:phosphoribosyl 1,2-cyclic phosphodiesterase
MEIRFWGTRGSTPSPGPSTVRYGGNTSCVEVRPGDGSIIILDAGTGIRQLGATLGPCQATLLLTHYHWDHVQGMPFFGPAYIPDSRIEVYGPESCGMGPNDLLDAQMSMPYFPAVPAQLAGVLSYAPTPAEPFRIGSATVRAGRVCHPSVTFGYRIEDEGSTVVYISDDEVDDATPEQLRDIIALARDADVLVHDCQYTEGEYPSHRGWGHSTPRMAVRLAHQAGVRHLVLFHHDPSHSDEQVEALAAEARALAGDLPISIAREGETLAIGASVPREQILEASEGSAG